VPYITEYFTGTYYGSENYPISVQNSDAPANHPLNVQKMLRSINGKIMDD